MATEVITPIDEYVLKAKHSAWVDFDMEYPNPSGSRIPLKKGINQIIVSWSGKSEVQVYWSTDGWNHRFPIKPNGNAPFPQIAEAANRQCTFTVPVAQEGITLFCMSPALAAEEVALPIGVQIANNAGLSPIT